MLAGAAVAIALATAVSAAAPTARAIAPMARVGPGILRPVYMPEPGVTTVEVKAFDLDRVPVTHAEFQRFVERNPRWRRDRVPTLFADAGYLADWSGPDAPGPHLAADGAVTRVSWFAAKAFCADQGKRLPSEAEWELAAAAGRHDRDGRAEPGFQARALLAATAPPPAGRRRVGQDLPNFWGVHDLDGLVWEWVLDFNGTLVTGDSREGKTADTLRFCGVGAQAAGDKSDYAGFLRIAFRSALEARYTAASLGFRCARDAEGDSR